MSHFNVYVILPKETDCTEDDAVRATTERLLAPYDEELEPYNGDMAKWDWWVFGGRWDGMIQGPETQYLVKDEDGFNFGDEHHHVPRNLRLLTDVLADHRRYAAGNEPLAKSEQERLTSSYTKHPSQLFTAQELTAFGPVPAHPYATGLRSDDPDPGWSAALAVYKKAYAAFEAAIPHEAREAKLALLLERHREAQRDHFLAFGCVTPDGVWHAQGQMGWFALVTNETEDATWAAELVALWERYREHYAVLVDCHS